MGGRVGQEKRSGNKEGQLCKMIKDYVKKIFIKKEKRLLTVLVNNTVIKCC